MTGHRNDVQGLRAVAVLLVAMYHSGLPLSGGFVGVDVFFVISGFVIGRLLWTEVRRTGTIDVPAFYARRVRRLLPGLAALLLFVGLCAFLFENPLGSQQNTAQTGLTALLFVANFHLIRTGYFDTPSQQNPLLHVWTLSVEEQFYAVFPLLLLLAVYLGRRARLRRAADGWAFGLLLAVCAISAGLGVALTGDSRLRALAFYGSPTRAWEFGVGALLALGESRIRVPATPAAFAGGAAIVAAAVGFSGATQFPGVAAALPVGGAALLIAAGNCATAGISRALTLPPLLWLGDRSYGFYLWHWPFIVFALALAGPAAPAWLPVAAAALALVPTALSYRYVEQPVRHGPRFRGRRVIRVAGVAVVAPAVVLVPLLLGVTFHTDAVNDFLRQGTAHISDSRNCDGNLPDDTTTRSACTWSTQGATGTIVLIGDSNAAQFAEPAIAAAGERRLDLVIATFSGCPFADVVVHYGLIDEGACRTFFESWVRYLSASRPALVIIANSAPLYLFDAPSAISLEAPTDHRIAVSSEAKTVLWQDAVRSSVRTLTEAGTPVVLVHTIPQFMTFALRTCPLLEVQLDPLVCNATQSRGDADARGRGARDAEDRALAGIAGATAVDFADDICDRSECSAFREGRWQYLDSRHLSVAGAMRLTPRFVALIEGAARAALAAAPRLPY